MANLLTLDAVFTTDQLDTQAASLQQALGLPPQPIPRSNVTQGAEISVDPSVKAQIDAPTIVDPALYDYAPGTTRLAYPPAPTNIRSKTL
jgi:hypothetical protein